MAKLMWAVLAQRVLVDQVTNTVSYIETVEQLETRSLPSDLPRVFVGTTWLRKEEGELSHIRFRVLTPSGKEIVNLEASNPVDFSNNKRHRINVDLRGMPVTEAGRFHVEVDQQIDDVWRVEASVPFDVIHNPEAPEADDDGSDSP